MRCKTFKTSLGWSDFLCIFSPKITWKEIKTNQRTKNIISDDYLGEFEFDEKFLNHLQCRKINGKKFWFENIYEHMTRKEEKEVYDDDIVDDIFD
jgi:hypothetical protein